MIHSKADFRVSIHS